MDFFEDRKFRKMAKKENIEPSSNYTKSVQNVLDNLEPKKENKINYNFNKIALNVAFATFVMTFVVLPNLSLNVSYAMQKIPVIGKFVKIVTIREYFEQDGKSEIDLNIPEVNKKDESEADKDLNKDVAIFTQKVIDEFNENKDPEQFYSVDLDNEVITNTNDWFTLKLSVLTVSGSSDTRQKYYNINKNKDKIIYLGDLFKDDSYKEIFKNEIQKQMKERMEKDENTVYWIEGEKEEWDFVDITNETNYYFSKSGNIVVVFDKYEVGPGSSGTPEFEIPKKLYENLYK